MEGLTLTGGSNGIVDVCLPQTSGYVVDVGGGTWTSEVSWSIMNGIGFFAVPGGSSAHGASGELVPICSNIQTQHEVRCCSDEPLAGFEQMHFGCSFAASDLTLAGGAGCLSNATYHEANFHCEAVGARLCTRLEVEASCVAATGCDFDTDLVWTTSNCTTEHLCAAGPNCGPLISEWAEGTSFNRYIEIYNPTNDFIDLADYAYPSVTNAPQHLGQVRKAFAVYIGASP